MLLRLQGMITLCTGYSVNGSMFSRNRQGLNDWVYEQANK